MSAKKQTTKKPAKYPVPEWMDEELKLTAEKLNVLERHALADRLERKASQLREMNQPKIDFIQTVSAQLRPKAKEAIILFAEQHGAAKYSEADKLACGTRWFLEIGLSQIKKISETAANFSHYRDAEGIENSVYSEKLIGAALEKWKAEIAEDDEEDCE
jgi:hypothetical protein